MAVTEQKPSVDLSWMKVSTEWGVRAIPDPKRGLTLEAVNIGSYGEAPERTTVRNIRPRGAAERPGSPRVKYWIEEKGEVFAYNMLGLYEEAVQRQWSSATDIPWHTIKPLPDELERSECQLATFLTIVEFVAGDVPGAWVDRMSPEHYETKAFLVSQIMDEARHLDVFRKRALINGGGLISVGSANAAAAQAAVGGGGGSRIDSSRNLAELAATLHISGEGFVLTMFRTGELLAQNEAEKRIYRLCAQDEARHVAFGILHTKYALEVEPWRREEINHFLDQGVGAAVNPNSGVTANFGAGEAQAILLGGGIKNIDKGYRKLMEIRRRQMEEFFHRCDVAGLPERRQRLDPEMKRFLEHPIID